MVQEQGGSITLPVREVGNAIHASTLTGGPISDIVMERVRADMKREQETLSWIRDMTFVGEPEIVESPHVDLLNRFRMYAWRQKFYSQGYEELKHHFRCRERHIPDRITMSFINQIINEYAQQEPDDDDDE